MPSKKKKYNARFPAGRIKKIMQTDEEVGKVAQAVPVIISRTLELFVESLLTKSMQITQSRNAKTLTPSHMKQCILSESRFDFLKDLVKNVPDATAQEDSDNANAESLALDYTLTKPPANDLPATIINKPPEVKIDTPSYYNLQSTSNTPPANDMPTTINSKPPEVKNDTPSFYNLQGSTSNTPSVIQYGPKVNNPVKESSKLNFSIESLVKKENNISQEPKIHIDLSHLVPTTSTITAVRNDIPPLVPITNNLYTQNTSDNLYIDEDYDN